MRPAVLLLLAACSVQTEDPAADDAPERRPVAEVGTDPRVTVWPGVRHVPANGLRFTVVVPEPVALDADFGIYRVDGDTLIEVEGALPEWRWNEPRTEARLTPRGLDTGAPYMLVMDRLLTDSGVSLGPVGHPFRMVPADTKPPDGQGLAVLGTPVPGTSEPLRIPLPEAVGREAVHKPSVLAGADPWPGTWALTDDQETLVFTPAEPWPDDREVVVMVGAGIRDLGGNELTGRPTDPIRPRAEAG